MSEKVFFGFKTVDKEDKETLVQTVFTSVASHYDLMNDFMSFGIQRLWKRQLIHELIPYEGKLLIDVAGGTGDIAAGYIKKGGTNAVVSDLNQEMLEKGKLKYRGEPIGWVQANAEELPFDSNSFDYYTISFGIRNVTNIDKVLSEAYRILRPTGKFICLEFSNITNRKLVKLYNWYAFNVIPFMGERVAGNREAYQYLVESIQKFPTAEQFKKKIQNSGFDFVKYRKLTSGIVAIHTGYKC